MTITTIGTVTPIATAAAAEGAPVEDSFSMHHGLYNTTGFGHNNVISLIEVVGCNYHAWECTQ